MKKINLNIAYPQYFKKENEKSYNRNYIDLKSKGIKEEEIKKVLSEKKFNPIEVTLQNLLVAILNDFQIKYKNGASWDIRKKHAKMVEKLYDQPEDQAIMELSEEQFDYIYDILKGNLAGGTVLYYITEELERLKFEEEKEKDKK